ncbi:DUF6188 family protein [Amycolatopsis sp. 195334CR]|uniref:DUF6188 family protein n=1 Tax=Amycolatopsis sp. 195334CR TaxID=2814588 RepID=UPI001A8D085D|nr:DUF6188 family protein [Amycolatopsis sp. 195334CR]MBN6037710.1 hypothetical protein [Amycolatopsis sp. 195334CR]
MEIPTALIGCEVYRTAFDYQVRLMLSAWSAEEGYRVQAELVVESELRFRDAAGNQHELTPGAGAALAPILDLFGKKITTVEVRERGTLHLGFDNGAELVVSPHPDYESWHLTGHGVDGITVGPGGEDGWT